MGVIAYIYRAKFQTLMKAASRILGLDILRTCAILFVLLGHGHILLRTHVSNEKYVFFPDGVAVFFVLSGFLIGTILLKTINQPSYGRRDVAEFWRNRWFRTLPAYFVVLTLVLLSRSIQEGQVYWRGYLTYFTFTQSVVDSSRAFRYDESWSLCIEEWFYLLTPLMLFFARSIEPRKRVLLVAFSLLLIVTLYRVYTVATLPAFEVGTWDTRVRKALLTRLDAIMFGVLCAYGSYYRLAVFERARRFYPLGIVLLLVPMVAYNLFGFTPFHAYASFTFESVGMALLMPYFSTLKGRAPAVTFISKISYSMYLLHATPFFLWVNPTLTRLGVPEEHLLAYDLLRLAVYLAWAFGASAVLYYLVEQPFLRLRDRLGSRRTTPALAVVAVEHT